MIYLDHNATTPVDPAVFSAMVPYLTALWGNPSSGHGFGQRAARAVDLARQQAAALVGGLPEEIVFTACGTESIHTALASALAARPARCHVVTTAVEHSVGRKLAHRLELQGYAVTRIPVDAEGGLEVQEVAEALRPDTAVVSVMWANNETGVVFPVAELAALCRSRGVLFHTDAVQVPGKLAIDVTALGVDYLSVSGHKFRAPKGVGLLYVRRGVPFRAQWLGGSQEGGRRAGTENVAGIVGLGKAAELAKARLPEMGNRVRALRDRLESGVLAGVAGTVVNGSRVQRLPNTTNLTFPGVEGEALTLLLDAEGICVSTGSACTSGSVEPSPVLLAMGRSAALARGSVRFSLGLDTTEADLDRCLGMLPGLVRRLREELPRF